MSESQQTPTAAQGGYEPCEECGAPLDAQQRYCVNCAARRGNGANPASRYFASMSKKSRRPLTGPRRKPAASGRAAAVAFFALLPIAVAIGVVVGRSNAGNGGEEALLQALKNQESAVASTAGPTATASPASKKSKDKSKAAKAANENGGKVVAKTKNGVVHQVTGYKPSQKQVEEDTKLVEENPEQTGENYIKAQQNLPDVVVVGGEGTGSEESSTPGVEP
jgi:hypothetical protein